MIQELESCADSVKWPKKVISAIRHSELYAACIDLMLIVFFVIGS